MVSHNVRGTIYWGLDFLVGSPVRRHLHNIRMVSKSEFPFAEHQARRLTSLLSHAAGTTDFYKGHDVQNGLNEFPVVNKIIIMGAMQRFRSSLFEGKKLKEMETSGSTGIPFRVVQDSDKRKRVLAELIEFNALVGYQVGSRHAFFRTIESLTAKSKLKLFMQNEVEFNVRIQDLSAIETQRQTLLEDKKIEILIGYSSVLCDLARHVISRGDTPASFGVKGVLCLSEALYSNMRETIREAFGCIVLSRYSNQECGLLAYECPACNQFHLNTADYIFETLDWERDEPSPPGMPGRLVVTDLYNYAMPMIRYDTGDIGSVIPSSCPKFGSPILKSLDGRMVDSMYDTSGRRLGSFVFDSIFETLNSTGVKIRQFQFIQEAKNIYKLRLCVIRPFLEERSILGQLKTILGQDAQILVEYIDEIPVLNSGKRKYIISNYQPDIQVPSSSM